MQQLLRHFCRGGAARRRVHFALRKNPCGARSLDDTKLRRPRISPREREPIPYPHRRPLFPARLRSLYQMPRLLPLVRRWHRELCQGVESVRVFWLNLQGLAKTGDRLVVVLVMKETQPMFIELLRLRGDCWSVIRAKKRGT